MYSNKDFESRSKKDSSTCYKWKTTVKYTSQGWEGMSSLPALDEPPVGLASFHDAALQAALTLSSGSTLWELQSNQFCPGQGS